MKYSAFPRIIKILLIFFSVAAALKILFVGFDLDEQYAVSMSYRLLKGDILVKDMWEPHQTSGFLAAFLMLPYVALTKSTTGIILYLRICGLFIHCLTAFLFYRQAGRILKEYTAMASDFCRDICRLITCICFFSLPKLMFFPEFSNMQMWFLLLLILCILHYYTQIISGRKAFPFWLFCAGICLSLEILSYPSSLLLFPACIYFILRCRQSGREKAADSARRQPSLARELASFCLPCLFSALLFAGYLLSHMSLQELAALLPLATSDGSHADTLTDKLITNGCSLLEILFYFAVYGLIALAISLPLKGRILLRDLPGRRPAGKKRSFAFIWGIALLFVTLLGQVLIWILGDRFPNYPSVEYFFVPALILVLISHRSKSERIFSFPLVILPLTAFAGIILMTNHPLLVSAPFLGICTAGALLCLFLHIKESRPLLRVILVFWVFVLLFGKCYLIRTTGGRHYTLFQPVSIMREGPAACLMADTGTVQQYNAFYDLLQEAVPEHSKIFYIGTANGIYMMGDMEYCTPSTISSPTFDEKIEIYFSMHPEKFPEYIICDSNLADLEGEGFLPDYLRKYCNPEPVSENDFLVIYRTAGNVLPEN